MAPVGGAAIGIGRIHAVLIAAGHRRAELAGYTRRQIRLFFEEAERIRRNHRADLVRDVNAAMAGGEDATRYLLDLIGDE